MQHVWYNMQHWAHRQYYISYANLWNVRFVIPLCIRSGNNWELSTDNFVMLGQGVHQINVKINIKLTWASFTYCVVIYISFVWAVTFGIDASRPAVCVEISIVFLLFCPIFSKFTGKLADLCQGPDENPRTTPEFGWTPYLQEQKADRIHGQERAGSNRRGQVGSRPGRQDSPRSIQDRIVLDRQGQNQADRQAGKC